MNNQGSNYGAILAFSILELSETFKQQHLSTLKGIRRGIERETLRIKDNGRLSTQPHNKELGSALTHEYITTDYSESLLEFITPATISIDQSLSQLKDVQKFALDRINGDNYWPMSMPCVVSDQDEVQLAQYGSSNIGKMKTVYRQGLKNRYGSLMQIIAGIHFNFSFPAEFFQALKEVSGSDKSLQHFTSEKYFSLIRNYKRLSWLIPYLYGSSPALCPTFLQGQKHNLPFKKAPTGCLYLEHATSLRMSDLGYTNSEQSSLNICYNSVESYVEAVQEAITLPSAEFARIGVKVDGEYQQLNSNILQIENELYSPIRPKRVAKSGQKPSEALSEGGVEYIEVRAMDVNPFVSTGISKQQMLFLDILLTYCALEQSPEFTKEEHSECNDNTNKVILEGRKPGLELHQKGAAITLRQLGNDIFDKFTHVAELLDLANDSNEYSQALSIERAKINDVTLTPSARILDELLVGKKGIVTWALEYAKQFNEELDAHQYQEFDEQQLVLMATESLEKQKVIEQGDALSFDQFLENYFAK